MDEDAAERSRDGGITDQQARAAARRDLGSVSLVAEDTRATWGWPVLEQVAQDARYALRSLRRTPGFTAAAVVTLALGIGVNTAIFSVVNGVLLNPLPYPAPDQLVAVYSRTADLSTASSSYPNFLDWARDNRSFSDLAAFRADDYNLTGLGQPERVPVQMVSASFFRLLGVQPVLGRSLLAADDRLGAVPVALIGESSLATQVRVVAKRDRSAADPQRHHIRHRRRDPGHVPGTTPGAFTAATCTCPLACGTHRDFAIERSRTGWASSAA